MSRTTRVRNYWTGNFVGVHTATTRPYDDFRLFFCVFSVFFSPRKFLSVAVLLRRRASAGRRNSRRHFYYTRGGVGFFFFSFLLGIVDIRKKKKPKFQLKSRGVFRAIRFFFSFFDLRENSVRDNIVAVTAPYTGIEEKYFRVFLLFFFFSGKLWKVNDNRKNHGKTRSTALGSDFFVSNDFSYHFR